MISENIDSNEERKYKIISFDTPISNGVIRRKMIRFVKEVYDYSDEIR